MCVYVYNIHRYVYVYIIYFILIYAYMERERERDRERQFMMFYPCIMLYPYSFSPFFPISAAASPGLWDLASPAGQRVNFTALENEVVAVDAA